jgi:hypothetical protein
MRLVEITGSAKETCIFLEIAQRNSGELAPKLRRNRQPNLFEIRRKGN